MSDEKKDGTANEWRHGDRISATVCIRRDLPGKKVKPEAEAIDGKKITAIFGWVMKDDEQFPGEVAWLLDREFDEDADILWIACGDLKDIVTARKSIPPMTETRSDTGR
jgi:hypothetical protein